MPPNSATNKLTAKPWGHHCGDTKLGHEDVDCKTVGIPLRCHQTQPHRSRPQNRGDTTAVPPNSATNKLTAKPWGHHSGASKLGHEEVDCKTVGIPLRCHQTQPHRSRPQNRGDTTAVSPNSATNKLTAKSWGDHCGLSTLGHEDDTAPVSPNSAAKKLTAKPWG